MGDQLSKAIQNSLKATETFRQIIGTLRSENDRLMELRERYANEINDLEHKIGTATAQQRQNELVIGKLLDLVE